MKTFFVRISLFVMLLLAVMASNVERSAAESAMAPILSAETAIPDSYIVVLKDTAGRSAQSSAVSLAETLGANVTHRYSTALNGFAAEMDAEAVETVRKLESVAFIEQNHTVSIRNTWGQDRINQRNLPLDGNFADAHGASGFGVHAYIIDTGIRTTHNEFGGRVLGGFDAIGGGYEDCDGHGTHVAGTVGGRTYGVAPNVWLYAVRVLDCVGDGTNASVLAGMDWVADNAKKPAVANMSLGGGSSTAIDNAVANIVSNGITVVVAAGNDNANACNYSPAGAPEAITVGSVDNTDTRASTSNWGHCLDVFAPGVSVLSAGIASDNATATFSGTSMASPHVAGVVALELQLSPNSSPAQVAQRITDTATRGVVNDEKCSYDLLVYSQLTNAGTPVPPRPDESECEGCVATFVVSKEMDERTAAEMLGLLYLLRDDVFARSEYGRQLTELFYQHSGRVTYLLATNRDLRADAADLLFEFEAGIRQVTGEKNRAVVAEKSIDNLQQFLDELATLDRTAKNGGSLATTIDAQSKQIAWDSYAGMSFTDAWAQLSQPKR